MSNANQVVCPACGEVRLETPPGTTALPTLGMARKAAGAGACDCGKAPQDGPGGPHTSEAPVVPGSGSASDVQD